MAVVYGSIKGWDRWERNKSIESAVAAIGELAKVHSNATQANKENIEIEVLKLAKTINCFCVFVEIPNANV